MWAMMPILRTLGRSKLMAGPCSKFNYVILLDEQRAARVHARMGRGLRTRMQRGFARLIRKREFDRRTAARNPRTKSAAYARLTTRRFMYKISLEDAGMLENLEREDVVHAVDRMVEELLTAAKVKRPPVDAIALAQKHLGMVVCLDQRQPQRGRAQKTAGQRHIYLRPEP